MQKRPAAVVAAAACLSPLFRGRWRLPRRLVLPRYRFAIGRLAPFRLSLMARAKLTRPASVGQREGRAESHERVLRSNSNSYGRRRSTSDRTWNPSLPIVLSSLQACAKVNGKSSGTALQTRALSTSTSTSSNNVDETLVDSHSATINSSARASTRGLSVQHSTGTSISCPIDLEEHPNHTGATSSRDLFEKDVVMTDIGVVGATLAEQGDFPQQSDEVSNVPSATVQAEMQESEMDAEEQKPASLFDYYMPEDTKHAALEARKKGLDRYWSYDMYRGPNQESVKRVYCTSKDESESTAQLFLGEKLLGLDLEWKPYVRKDADAPLKDRVSLIQIASQDRVGLFHIASFSGDEIEDLVPPTLKQIIEDENVTKIGVNIANDGNRLREYLGINSKGLFELSHLHRLVKYAKENPRWVNKRLVALSSQVEEHLLLPLFKGEVRVSDWTRRLTVDQIRYAASDVYSSLHLYDQMDMKRRAMKPVPPMPEHWEKKAPIRLHTFQSFSGKSSLSDENADDPDVAPVAEDGDIADGDATKTGELSTSATPVKSRQRKASTPRTKKTEESAQINRPPEYQRSEAWAIGYRNTEAFKQKAAYLQCNRPELRAYALWQHYSLDVPELAAMLSIKEQTAASYVARTLQLEELVYDCERVRLMLTFIPQSVISSRYWKFKYHVPPAPMVDKIVVALPAVEEQVAASTAAGTQQASVATVAT